MEMIWRSCSFLLSLSFGAPCTKDKNNQKYVKKRKKSFGLTYTATSKRLFVFPVIVVQSVKVVFKDQAGKLLADRRASVVPTAIVSAICKQTQETWAEQANPHGKQKWKVQARKSRLSHLHRPHASVLGFKTLLIPWDCAGKSNLTFAPAKTRDSDEWTFWDEPSVVVGGGVEVGPPWVVVLDPPSSGVVVSGGMVDDVGLVVVVVVGASVVVVVVAEQEYLDRLNNQPQIKRIWNENNKLFFLNRTLNSGPSQVGQLVAGSVLHDEDPVVDHITDHQRRIQHGVLVDPKVSCNKTQNAHVTKTSPSHLSGRRTDKHRWQCGGKSFSKARRQGQPLTSTGDSEQAIYTFTWIVWHFCTFGCLDLCLTTGNQVIHDDFSNPRLQVGLNDLLASLDYLYCPPFATKLSSLSFSRKSTCRGVDVEIVLPSRDSGQFFVDAVMHREQRHSVLVCSEEQRQKVSVVLRLQN